MAIDYSKVQYETYVTENRAPYVMRALAPLRPVLGLLKVGKRKSYFSLTLSDGSRKTASYRSFWKHSHEIPDFSGVVVRPDYGRVWIGDPYSVTTPYTYGDVTVTESGVNGV